MKKILAFLLIIVLTVALAGCESLTSRLYEGGEMSVDVPPDWKASYSEATNQLTVEDTGEEGSGGYITFQLIGEELTAEQAATLFEGTIGTHQYEDLGTETIGGLEMKAVSFTYDGMSYRLYGGNVHNGQQFMVTSVNLPDETKEKSVLESFAFI